MTQHTLTIFPEYHCYVRKWIGETIANHVIEYWRSLAENPAWNPDLHTLHDLRQISINQTFQEILAQADELGERLPDGTGNTVFLVNDNFKFGMARQRLAVHDVEEGSSLVTFSEAEAKEYIGLPVDQPL